MNDQQRLRKLEAQFNIYFVPHGSEHYRSNWGLNLVLRECLVEDSFRGMVPGFEVLETSKRTAHLAVGDKITDISEIYRGGE